MLGFLQLFSGGALTQFAVFALGIMPYITSSIIMQILTVVIPKLEQWQKQGAVGQRKITQWTRYVTVGIAIMQSTGLVFLFHNGGGGFFASVSTNLDLVPNFTIPRVLLIVVTLTAGTALIMWMGELITQRGIGNGMSILIFTSVVSSYPSTGSRVRAEAGNGALAFLIVLFVAAHRGHRLRRAGPASHPGPVRQAGRGPAHVRRPEHLHPAQGEPVGRDPDHLRQLGAVPAAAALQRAARRRAGAPPSRSGSTTTWSSPPAPSTSRSTAC